MQVVEDPRKDKPSHIETRKKYYDWLASEIKIEGIISVERDHAFDNETFTSGGVRLIYKTVVDPVGNAITKNHIRQQIESNGCIHHRVNAIHTNFTKFFSRQCVKVIFQRPNG
jgi:hypothetical protein